jgi:hypothetical protein
VAAGEARFAGVSKWTGPIHSLWRSAGIRSLGGECRTTTSYIAALVNLVVRECRDDRRKEVRNAIARPAATAGARSCAADLLTHQIDVRTMTDPSLRQFIAREREYFQLMLGSAEPSDVQIFRLLRGRC